MGPWSFFGGAFIDFLGGNNVVNEHKQYNILFENYLKANFFGIANSCGDGKCLNMKALKTFSPTINCILFSLRKQEIKPLMYT